MATIEQRLKLMHDRIDKREELIDRVTRLANQVVADEMPSAVEVAEASGTRGLETFRKALEIISARVAEDLADLTTEAVHAGADHSRKLVRMEKGSIAEEVVTDEG